MNIGKPQFKSPDLAEHTAPVETDGARFEQQLHRIFAVPSNGNLMPDPRIQKRLLAHLQHSKARKPLFHSLVRLLDMRIPVYQAAFAVAILLSAVLISDRWMNAQTPSGPTRTENLTAPQAVSQTPQSAPHVTLIDSLSRYRESVSDTFFTSGIPDSL